MKRISDEALAHAIIDSLIAVRALEPDAERLKEYYADRPGALNPASPGAEQQPEG